MFLWPMAANAPSSMDAIEMKTMICCQSTAIGSKAPMVTRTTRAIAAIFGAAAKKAVRTKGRAGRVAAAKKAARARARALRARRPLDLITRRPVTC